MRRCLIIAILACQSSATLVVENEDFQEFEPGAVMQALRAAASDAAALREKHKFGRHHHRHSRVTEATDEESTTPAESKTVTVQPELTVHSEPEASAPPKSSSRLARIRADVEEAKKLAAQTDAAAVEEERKAAAAHAAEIAAKKAAEQAAAAAVLKAAELKKALANKTTSAAAEKAKAAEVPALKTEVNGTLPDKEVEKLPMASLVFGDDDTTTVMTTTTTMMAKPVVLHAEAMKRGGHVGVPPTKHSSNMTYKNGSNPQGLLVGTTVAPALSQKKSVVAARLRVSAASKTVVSGAAPAHVAPAHVNVSAKSSRAVEQTAPTGLWGRVTSFFSSSGAGREPAHAKL